MCAQRVGASLCTSSRVNLMRDSGTVEYPTASDASERSVSLRPSGSLSTAKNPRCVLGRNWRDVLGYEEIIKRAEAGGWIKTIRIAQAHLPGRVDVAWSSDWHDKYNHFLFMLCSWMISHPRCVLALLFCVPSPWGPYRYLIRPGGVMLRLQAMYVAPYDVAQEYQQLARYRAP